MINSNSAISASNASQASPSGARGKTETASPETPVIIRVEHDIVLKSANSGPFQAATYNPCGVVFSFGVTPQAPPKERERRPVVVLWLLQGLAIAGPFLLAVP